MKNSKRESYEKSGIKRSASSFKSVSPFKSITPFKSASLFKKESSAFIAASREITVCQCKKVIEYTPESVKLLLCDGIMEITGNALTVSTYFGSEIKLSGSISAIFLSEDNKR